MFGGLIALAVLCFFAVQFIGLDVAEQRLFPSMSIGWRHALLTGWALVVTSAACAGVYLLMRRQQRRLSAIATELARLLESYQSNPSSPGRFENPYLVHCREVIGCERQDCPMYDSPGKRCWQVMALARANGDRLPPRIEIQKCLTCDAYRLSCPDKLTELGESFNNLMFLLEVEAEQVGHLRVQMAKKEKMVAIGQIAAGVAHEVGNPLSSISSIVQILKRARSSGPMLEQLDLIETHIQRISATVRRLVSLARPVVERWEPVDVGKALDEVIRLVAFDRRARKVDIELESPDTLPRTVGMRGQLQQVFINLLLNALDAMPDSGRLTVHAGENDGNIVVRVRDTGQGIAAEAAQRVFEPFFTTKPSGHGTGLGLAVSYNIVKKHRGTINFTSTVGQGTEFVVRIPVLDKAPDL